MRAEGSSRGESPASAGRRGERLRGRVTIWSAGGRELLSTDNVGHPVKVMQCLRSNRRHDTKAYHIPFRETDKQHALAPHMTKF